jgi:hypothetical protein
LPNIPQNILVTKVSEKVVKINETCAAWMDSQIASSNEAETEISTPNNLLTSLASISLVGGSAS